MHQAPAILSLIVLTALIVLGFVRQWPAIVHPREDKAAIARDRRPEQC